MCEGTCIVLLGGGGGGGGGGKPPWSYAYFARRVQKNTANELTYDPVEWGVGGVGWYLIIGVQYPQLGPIFKRVHLVAQLVQ